MPAYPSKKDRPALRRAGRLAAFWGWSYILTLVALYGVSATPPGPLRVLVLNTSLLFAAIGVAELYWRRRLLVTGQARWVRILALNEVAGTLVLLWNIYLVDRISPALLTSLITPDTRHALNQLGEAMHTPVTEAMIENSFRVAKSLTMYGVGGILLLSQVWIIYRYLSLAPAIEREANIPPVLQ